MRKPAVQQEISCFVLPVFALQISAISFYFSAINEHFQQLAQNYVAISDDKPVFDCENGINGRELLCKMTMRTHL